MIPRCVPLVPMYSVSSTSPCGSVCWMRHVPGLRVGDAEVRIDGVGIGQRGGRGGEAVLDGQRRRRCWWSATPTWRTAAARPSGWRSARRKSRCRRCCSRCGSACSASGNGRHAKPKRGEKLCGLERTMLLGSAPEYGPFSPAVTTATAVKPGTHVQVRQVAAQFRVRREVLVAQPQVDGEPRADAEIVLRIRIGAPAAEVIARTAEAHRTGLRQAQQEIGEIEARALHRLAVGIQLAGDQAAEAKTIRARSDSSGCSVAAGCS